MNRNRIKIILDLLLAITIILLYNTRTVTGLSFHEWAGIIIAVAFIVHIALSWDWIVAVTRKFFGRTTARARVLYVLDVLVLVAMGWTIASGLFISKIAVPSLATGASQIWRQTHEPVAWLTLLLIGIHLGLHWRWVMDVTRRIFKRSRASVATLVVLRVLAAALFLGGVYASVATNAFGQAAALLSTRASADQGGVGYGAGGQRPQGDQSPFRRDSGGFHRGQSGADGRGGSGPDANANVSALVLGSGVLATLAVPSYYLDALLLKRRRHRGARGDISTDASPGDPAPTELHAAY